MDTASLVIQKSLEMVAKSRAAREHAELQRKETYSCLQFGPSLEHYLEKPGQQLKLRLDS
jgi:hypothetical protein